jgi:hypothetical protein
MGCDKRSGRNLPGQAARLVKVGWTGTELLLPGALLMAMLPQLLAALVLVDFCFSAFL